MIFCLQTAQSVGMFRYTLCRLDRHIIKREKRKEMGPINLKHISTPQKKAQQRKNQDVMRCSNLICNSHLGSPPSSAGVDKDRRLLGLITRASNIEPQCFYLLPQPEILPFGRLYRRLYCKALNYSVAARIGRGGERLRGKRHYLWQQPLFLLLFHLAAHWLQMVFTRK